MPLPKTAVLRCYNRKYLDELGRLISDRSKAVVLTPEAARKFVASFPTRDFSDPLFGLSVEECSKKERRRVGPVDTTVELRLLHDTRRNRLLAQARRLLQQADDCERAAKHYRTEANRMIELDD